jgi:oligoendopeptidase F
MRALLASGAAAAILGTQVAQYEVDLSRYFTTPAAESQSRAALESEVSVAGNAAPPKTPEQLRQRLETYERLLAAIRRHSIYLRLRAAADVNDTEALAAARDAGRLERGLRETLTAAIGAIGSAERARLTRDRGLAPYVYFLGVLERQHAHALSPSVQRTADQSVTPALDAATARERILRKSDGTLASHEDEYAALLVTIETGQTQLAKLRGFSSAVEAVYFDRFLSPDSVDRILQSVRAATETYANYRRLSAQAPRPGVRPPRLAFADAIPVILAAERPLGSEYALALEALLDPAARRVDLCTADACDGTGFSVGFSGTTSGLYFGGYSGTLSNVRAVAHEAAHAVHRELMNLHQLHPVYNDGPNYVFESFATLNELLLYDHLSRSAKTTEERAFYLNAFLDDATFQVFGSAEETELEASMYRGVSAGTIKSAADFTALTRSVFGRYDPASAQDSRTPLYWARNRLYFSDPLYDVNYLYAGLLALKYVAEFERDPRAFAAGYVALQKNGFTDSPAVLEKSFLGIDMTDETALVENARAVIARRTTALSRLYSGGAPAR